MHNLQNYVHDYLEYCRYQKQLSDKTLKAYRIDLKQFTDYMQRTDQQLNRLNLNNFITWLRKNYKPKSAKRKIASLKAFFTYLEYEEILENNPCAKIKSRFREPFLLPRTITSSSLQQLFEAAYRNRDLEAVTLYQKKCAARDVAVLELLFSTGLRVSELCSIKKHDLNFEQGFVRIYGKGAKERVVMLSNLQVLSALKFYQSLFEAEIAGCGFFFCNRAGRRLSEQSVRFMINRYADLSELSEHITPHMFRHTFATMLLEEDVDIRYIQQILGHSSIMTTQIYTHVTAHKQRDILLEKNPRNKIRV